MIGSFEPLRGEVWKSLMGVKMRVLVWYEFKHDYCNVYEALNGT